MDSQIKHRTFFFERMCKADIKSVFVALSDPVARARWSAPSNAAAFVYDAADFREGGQDLFRCGAKDDPQFVGLTTYIAIVPDRLIASSEIIESGGTKLMTSLITTQLASNDEITKLFMTVQVTSFVGEEMISDTEIGYKAALNNLMDHVAA